MGTKYRHEWKHEINAADRIAIRQRLRAVARTDPHAVDGKYLIRSLYLDDLKDRALREKIDGVNPRENSGSVITTAIQALSTLRKSARITAFAVSSVPALQRMRHRILQMEGSNG